LASRFNLYFAASLWSLSLFRSPLSSFRDTSVYSLPTCLLFNHAPTPYRFPGSWDNCHARLCLFVTEMKTVFHIFSFFIRFSVSLFFLLLATAHQGIFNLAQRFESFLIFTLNAQLHCQPFFVRAFNSCSACFGSSLPLPSLIISVSPLSPPPLPTRRYFPPAPPPFSSRPPLALLTWILSNGGSCFNALRNSSPFPPLL